MEDGEILHNCKHFVWNWVKMAKNCPKMAEINLGVPHMTNDTIFDIFCFSTSSFWYFIKLEFWQNLKKIPSLKVVFSSFIARMAVTMNNNKFDICLADMSVSPNFARSSVSQKQRWNHGMMTWWFDDMMTWSFVDDWPYSIFWKILEI